MATEDDRKLEIREISDPSCFSSVQFNCFAQNPGSRRCRQASLKLRRHERAQANASKAPKQTHTTTLWPIWRLIGTQPGHPKTWNSWNPWSLLFQFSSVQFSCFSQRSLLFQFSSVQLFSQNPGSGRCRQAHLKRHQYINGRQRGGHISLAILRWRKFYSFIVFRRRVFTDLSF